jgi:hypothetical protein
VSTIDSGTATVQIPDQILAEFGFMRGAAPAVTYRCDDAGVVWIPLSELRVPRVEPWVACDRVES